MEEKKSRGSICLDFLKEIAANNNRIWFENHRDEYNKARMAFESMVDDLLKSITEFDEGIGHLTVKDCTYRFYRDIRFSPDKSPYKRHFGAYINSHGKKSYHGGYYLHIEPGNCLLGGGAYCLTPPILRSVRREIMENIGEFREIVEAPAFRDRFPEIGMERIKTVPQGFRKDFPYMQYIRPKDYSVVTHIPDTFFDDAGWLSTATEVFKVMKPYLDFLNFTIDDYE